MKYDPPKSVEPAEDHVAIPGQAPVEAPLLPRTDLGRLDPVAAGLVVAGAVLFDLGLHTGVTSLATTLAVGLTVVVLVGRSGPRPTGATVAFGTAAVIFGAWLALRTSTWLAALNSLAVAGSLALVALARRGPLNPLDRLGTASVLAAIERLLGGRFAPAILARSLRPNQGRPARLGPYLRGVALAAVPVLVLGALLASADAVFASVVDIDLDFGPLAGHAALALLAALAIVALAAVGATPAGDERDDWRPIGGIEALIVLGSVAALFAGFAGVQLYSVLGQADEILARAGVTPADYARSGYFQLLWVAALTAGLLAVLRLLVADAGMRVDRGIRSLGAVVALLTCAIVVSAIVRLGLYVDAFGQTTLRWYSGAFAWMLGIGFVAIAAGHHPRVGRHLPLALTSLTAVTLFAVNAINPEARVAAHNLSRVGQTQVELDIDYLTGLSADAWPTLLGRRDLLGPQGATRCAEADESAGFGPFGANLARLRLDC